MTEDQMATAELVGRARQGDGNAFGIRMDPYRLYRIAIHRSLNALRSVSRPPVWGSSIAWTDPPGAARVSEAPWLEPYPDVLLDQIADAGAGPEARYERSEAISLAFITALQLLPFDNSSLARFGLPRTVQA
jgi:hypothetical protein